LIGAILANLIKRMRQLLAKSKLGTSQFVEATLALRDKRESRFGLIDATMSLALIFGGVAIARFILANL
jgi:hypothetical protein